MSNSAPTLSTRQIWTLYFPLALSWLFMAMEGPISVRVISSVGPEVSLEEIWTAGFNALLAISLLIESPVIDLLSTSTTLCKGANSYRTISRFVLVMMAVCTVGHMLVVWPPIYNLVTAKFGQSVRDALYWPLVVMIPWSAAIGWRRYKQGILIRYGETRLVGIGTFIRMTVMAGVGFGLAASGAVSGLMAAAWSLIGAVVAEAIFIHWAAKKPIAKHVSGVEDAELDTARLYKFHLPLTATTMMQLGTNIMITQALASSVDHELSWPGFQVALALMWLNRAVLYALPEVVITMYSRPNAPKVLWRFCGSLSIAMTALMVLFGLFGVDKMVFIHILDKTPQMAETAHQIFMLSCLVPVLVGLQSYVRGVLAALHTTMPRMLAIFAGLVTMGGVLFYGLAAKWPGAWLAAAGPTLGFVVELAVLAVAMRRARAREASAAH